MMKKTAALLIAAAMIFQPIQASALDTELADGYANGIIAFEKHINGIGDDKSLLSGNIAEGAANDSSDWLAIGAIRSGLEDNTTEYYNCWLKRINDKYTHDGGLDRYKATEWHRAVLTAICLGADPADISGIDLLNDGVYSRGDDMPLDKQGLNGWIWALIAVDSCDWKVPDNSKVTRLDMINTIIDSQNPDGGFSIDRSDARSDPDLTAMALQALSPYRSCPETQDTISKAVDYLAEKQADYDTCETCAQVICALCCMGIDPDEDRRFSALTDELIDYSKDDGGFAHSKCGMSNELASAQALIALCSLERLRSGERSIYDMNDGPPISAEGKDISAVAAAKERNTNAPQADDLTPWVVEKLSLKAKIALFVSVLALCSATVAVGIIMRKRKERSQ